MGYVGGRHGPREVRGAAGIEGRETKMAPKTHIWTPKHRTSVNPMPKEQTMNPCDPYVGGSSGLKGDFGGEIGIFEPK